MGKNRDLNGFDWNLKISVHYLAISISRGTRQCGFLVSQYNDYCKNTEME